MFILYSCPRSVFEGMVECVFFSCVAHREAAGVDIHRAAFPKHGGFSKVHNQVTITYLSLTSWLSLETLYLFTLCNIYTFLKGTIAHLIFFFVPFQSPCNNDSHYDYHWMNNCYIHWINILPCTKHKEHNREWNNVLTLLSVFLDAIFTHLFQILKLKSYKALVSLFKRREC